MNLKLVALASTALSAIACGSSSGGASGQDDGGRKDGGPDGAMTDAGPITDPAVFAAMYCDLFAPCCNDLGVPPGGDGCRSIIGNTASLVGKTAELGAACIADLEAVFARAGYCNYYLSGVASCNAVLGQGHPVASATAPPGGACQDASGCAPSVRGQTSCNFDATVSPAVLRCQELIRGARGDSPCAGTVIDDQGNYSAPGFIASGYLCAMSDGLYCSAATGACEPLRQPGASCADNLFACDFCDAAGTCAARAALGGACMVGGCVAGAFCDSTSKCALKLPMGAPCDLPPDCLSGNCPQTTCQPAWSASQLGFLCGAS